MEKFHLKTLLSDKTYGICEINHSRFEIDLKDTFLEMSKKYKFESIEELDPKLLSNLKGNFEIRFKEKFDLSDLDIRELRDLISVFSFEDRLFTSAYSKDETKVKKIIDSIEIYKSLSLTKKLWKDSLYFNQNYSLKSRSLINNLCLKIFADIQRTKNTSKRLMVMHNEFKIFTNDCFKLIAQKMLNEKDSEVLDRLYMNLFDFQTGFGDRVVEEMIFLLNSYLNNVNIDRASHITKVLSDNNGHFIVSRKLYVFCSSLLLVFKDRKVSEEIVNIISKFIENNLGDPRISKQWANIDPEAKKVYMKWKVAASTELFFKIITESLSGELDEYKKRWAKRERFWRNYLEKEVIHSAWLVLSSQGENFYKRISKKDEIIPYGKINGQNNMLILFIGDLKIVEFAPTGRVSIWRDSNSFAPEAYANQYNEDKVRLSYSRGPLLIASHDSSGGWMSDVEKIIYQETNIKVRK